MQTIAGLTLLELLEHLARAMYIIQLLITPVDFINANLLEGPTPALVHWSRLSAVFLIGLKGAVPVVQMKAPSVKPSMWLNQSVCWGLCGVLSYLASPASEATVISSSSISIEGSCSSGTSTSRAAY